MEHILFLTGRLAEPSLRRVLGSLADAQMWAAEVAGLAPLSLRHSKRVLNDDGAYQEQDAVHRELFDQAWGSQDVIEAQVARVQKRAPRFAGA